MTGYRAGAVLERAARAVLEANGYWVVRAAGSKGRADLVALKPGEVLLVQCKLDGKCPPAERAELWNLASRLSYVWVTYGDFPNKPGLALPLVAGWVKEGRAARTVGFRRLTGAATGRGHRVTSVAWTPDYGLEET